MENKSLNMDASMEPRPQTVKYRSSLKRTKSKSDLSSPNQTDRRVSFANTNVVKPFLNDPERFTIWDKSYEEKVNHTDSTQSENTQSTSQSTSCISNVSSKAKQTILPCQNLPDALEKNKENLPKEFLELCSNQFNTTCYADSMELTCQNDIFIDDQLRNNEIEDSNMEFTCQLAFDTNIANKSRVTNFTVHEEVDMNETCNNVVQDIDLEKKETALCAIPVHDDDYMELTCQFPNKILSKNIVSAPTVTDLLTETISEPTDMEFTCNFTKKLINKNNGIASSVNILTGSNVEPVNISVDDSMELTCQFSNKNLNKSIVNDPTFKNILTKTIIEAADMELTCQFSKKNIVSASSGKNHSAGTVAEVADTPFDNNMQLTCQFLNTNFVGASGGKKPIAGSNGELAATIVDDNIELTCHSSQKSLNKNIGTALGIKTTFSETVTESNDMDFTCKNINVPQPFPVVPVSPKDQECFEESMDLTCKYDFNNPLDIETFKPAISKSDASYFNKQQNTSLFPKALSSACNLSNDNDNRENSSASNAILTEKENTEYMECESLPLINELAKSIIEDDKLVSTKSIIDPLNFEKDNKSPDTISGISNIQEDNLSNSATNQLNLELHKFNKNDNKVNEKLFVDKTEITSNDGNTNHINDASTLGDNTANKTKTLYKNTKDSFQVEPIQDSLGQTQLMSQISTLAKTYVVNNINEKTYVKFSNVSCNPNSLEDNSNKIAKVHQNTKSLASDPLIVNQKVIEKPDKAHSNNMNKNSTDVFQSDIIDNNEEIIENKAESINSFLNLSEEDMSFNTTKKDEAELLDEKQLPNLETELHSDSNKKSASAATKVIYSEPMKVTKPFTQNLDYSDGFPSMHSSGLNPFNFNSIPSVEDTQLLIHATFSKPDFQKDPSISNINNTLHLHNTLAPEQVDDIKECTLNKTENVNENISSETLRAQSVLQDIRNKLVKYTFASIDFEQIKKSMEEHDEEHECIRKKFEKIVFDSKFSQNSLSDVFKKRNRRSTINFSSETNSSTSFSDAAISTEENCIVLEPVKTLPEKIQEICQRSEDMIVLKHFKECHYVFTTCKECLYLYIEIHPEDGRVIEIKQRSVLKDTADILKHFVIKNICDKLEDKSIKSYLGADYDILTLLDYLRITVEEVLDFHYNFLLLQNEYATLRLEDSFFIFEVIDTSKATWWVVRFKMLSIHKISHEEIFVNIYGMEWGPGKEYWEEHIKRNSQSIVEDSNCLKNFLQQIKELFNRDLNKIK